MTFKRGPAPISDRLERVSHRIEKIAGIFLGMITCLVFVSAIGRYLFAAPFPDSFDISRLMMGVAVLWGFASVGYRGSHIKVDLVAEMLPDRIRRWLDVTAWLVLLGFTIALAWMLHVRVSGAYASGEATFDLRIPVWPFLGAMWLGVLASIVTISVRILLLARSRDTGLAHYETLEADGDETS